MQVNLDKNIKFHALEDIVIKNNNENAEEVHVSLQDAMVPNKS